MEASLDLEEYSYLSMSCFRMFSIMGLNADFYNHICLGWFSKCLPCKTWAVLRSLELILVDVQMFYFILLNFLVPVLDNVLAGPFWAFLDDWLEWKSFLDNQPKVPPSPWLKSGQSPIFEDQCCTLGTSQSGCYLATAVVRSKPAKGRHWPSSQRSSAEQIWPGPNARWRSLFFSMELVLFAAKQRCYESGRYEHGVCLSVGFRPRWWQLAGSHSEPCLAPSRIAGFRPSAGTGRYRGGCLNLCLSRCYFSGALWPKKRQPPEDCGVLLGRWGQSRQQTGPWDTHCRRHGWPIVTWWGWWGKGQIIKQWWYVMICSLQHAAIPQVLDDVGAYVGFHLPTSNLLGPSTKAVIRGPGLKWAGEPGDGPGCAPGGGWCGKGKRAGSVQGAVRQPRWEVGKVKLQDLLISYHLGSNIPGVTLVTGLAVWSPQKVMAKINFRKLAWNCQLVSVSQKLSFPTYFFKDSGLRLSSGSILQLPQVPESSIDTYYFDFFRNSEANIVCSPWSYENNLPLENRVDSSHLLCQLWQVFSE